MKDFRQDIIEIERRLRSRRPFALGRFGDGELAVLENRAIDLRNKSEFSFDPDDAFDVMLRQQLLAALSYKHQDYYVGIVCPCCAGQEAFAKQQQLSGQSKSQLTWANIWVNSNYPFYCQHIVPLFQTYEVRFICGEHASLESLPFRPCQNWRVGINAWRQQHQLIEIVRQETAHVRGGLFLFAAGPMSNLLVHQLFAANPHNSYLNIGATLDPLLFGDRGFTRGYLCGAPTLQKTCIWESPPISDSIALQSSKAKPLGPAGASANWESEDITVILTAYRRPQLLSEQVRAIRAQSRSPQAIWAWANAPSAEMRALLDRMKLDRVVLCSENARFHGRFALALTARTPYVAIFDDDTIPGQNWFENCLATMSRHLGILGTAGVRLHGDLYSPNSKHGWHMPCNEVTEVDLVGQAWFLRTEWVRHLFAEKPVTGSNGEDIELAARAFREAGIRSYCPPHPPSDRSQWGSLRGDELGSDSVATWRHNPQAHLKERDLIVAAETSAGWKPMNRRTMNPLSTPPIVSCASQLDLVVDPMRRSENDSWREGDVTRPNGAKSDRQKQFAALLPEGVGRVLLVGNVVDGWHEMLRQQGIEAQVLDLATVAAQGSSNREFGLDVRAESFDCVICDRILAFSRDPLALLRMARGRLRPDGCLLVSIPNARHISTINAIMRGDWTHDCTQPQLRFYTRRDVEKLLFRGGFDVQHRVPLGDTAYQAWQNEGCPAEVALENLTIGCTSRAEAEEFYAGEYLFAAHPSPPRQHELTSIVIVTHNQCGFTHQCIQSIRERTDEPYELILVDNGSSDETPDYLATIPGARVIRNPGNRGFPAAANQGIKAARGQQILLLNNDTVVTTGWLHRMLTALERHPDVGLVGPCSNAVSGSQQIAVSYDDLASVDGFAWDFGQANNAQVQPVDRLVGFCLLVRREVVERIGLLDERFGIGNFEDDDYCRRAAQAGFRAAIARDCFVHHFGHATFQASGIDFGALLRRNEQLYREKWGADVAERDVPNDPPLHIEAKADDLKALPDSIARPKLSLCMIVRDNEGTIRPALESIRPWVDEMIVVDTGSQDRTPEIVAEIGAQVFHFPWCDHFSAARNESLRHARGEWIFWMDSDDTISPENGRRLRELVLQLDDKSPMGYVMQVHCPGSGQYSEAERTIVDQVKVFRNLPQLRFEGRIHEQILMPIRRAGGDIVQTDIFVTHSGADHSEEGLKRKLKRDLRILEQELQEQPNHPFHWFNLGMTLGEAKEHSRAQEALERCLNLSEPHESHVRKAYALLVCSQVQQGLLQEAQATCRHGLTHFVDDPELLFRAGTVAQQLNQPQEALRCYQTLLATGRQDHLSSVDRGIFGFKTHHNLATVYSELGDWSTAEKHWRAAIGDVEQYREGWEGVHESLLRQHRHAEAEQLALDLERRPTMRGLSAVLLAKGREEVGDFDGAKRILEASRPLWSTDLEPLKALCRLLFERDNLAHAQAALEELVSRYPAEPSALHNLGTVYFRQGAFERAATTYRRTLELRSDYVPTYIHLAQALAGLGKPAETQQVLIRASQLAPHDPTIRAMLAELGAHRTPPA